MKQPMSKSEIAAWDAIATGLIISGHHPNDAYDAASDAIASRRAALIADAHVGRPWPGGGWSCNCDSHIDSDPYCERCHTRRPDNANAIGGSRKSVAQTADIGHRKGAKAPQSAGTLAHGRPRQ